MIEIRKTIIEDLTELQVVIDSSELFPSEMLDEMIDDYLNNPDSEELWLSCLMGKELVGFAYCIPEKLTDGTYNLLAVGVLKELRGQGIGKKMISYVEDQLRQLGKRILIIETSSDEQYESTQKFYSKLDYRLEATIHDFWTEGEHKLIYLKKLN